jgi:hypothetical protein
MSNLLQHPRWHDVLIELHGNTRKKQYCQKLHRALKGSLTHLRAIVRRLAYSRLVEIQPTAKTKRLQLTDKGKRVAGFIIGMKTELGLL